MKRFIDLNNWDRAHLFRSYLGTDLPYIIIGADLDVTKLYRFTKQQHLSFYFSMIYAATKTADEIVNFRYRFQDGQPFELPRNTAFATHMRKGSEMFHMVACDHYDSLKEFALKNHEKGEIPLPESGLDQLKGRDDIINYSCIPWISYNHFFRTISKCGIDCNPKISMGKFKKEQDRILLPFSVQVHHGLMDGYHVGKYYNLLEEYLQSENWN